MSQPPVKRSLCAHCGYPTGQCVCHLIAPVTGDVTVWVLQDKHEAKHAKNSARLFALCYDKTRIVSFAEPEQLSAFMDAVDPEQALLLFPGEQALAVESLSQAKIAAIKHLILLDGTWPKAKKMLWLEERLGCFKQGKFTHAPRSQYEIRKSPNAEALSTLEAAVYALECCGNAQISNIRDFFSDVIALQWSKQPEEHKHRS
ncbi:DTW domain protein [Marinomonas aquimarina]|uniref:tRNA-uridine aminocarboxypropyltransferase n=1 Tax=Marinomonas aquimarina TaxID=295068 RepID=A0A1A8T2S6_9GAMM|nr:tRNA-uridine aminocarboxypropyltransferase [Marinomonas aquimarina]SBS26072.1 DTW domain protein [Marinomonas aquimarina]